MNLSLLPVPPLFEPLSQLLTPFRRGRAYLSTACSFFPRLLAAFAPLHHQRISPFSVTPLQAYLPPLHHAAVNESISSACSSTVRNFTAITATVPPLMNLALYRPFLFCSTPCHVCTVPSSRNLRYPFRSCMHPNPFPPYSFQ